MAGQTKLTTADGQARLRLVPPIADFNRTDSSLRKSIIDMTRHLVSIPSQGGIDHQKKIITELADWLYAHGVPVGINKSDKRKEHNSYMGVYCEVGSGGPPFYLMTACLDTAPFGSTKDWNYEPTSGRLDESGWLFGRGSADSKIAVAIFSHILVSLNNQRLKGTLVFLADSDEHTGRFGAVKDIVEKKYLNKLSGAYIGYPGMSEIKIGARGFYRTTVKFYGTAGHSGSRSRVEDNAIQKASRFCVDLLSQKIPTDDEASFSFGPKVSVTSIRGGTKSYSMIPDRCSVRIDVRLTPSFQKKHARELIQRCVSSVGETFGGRKPAIEAESSWPAYKIDENSQVLKALRSSVREILKKEPSIGVCGPSNVGNYLASHGIDAICGFGVDYKNIHAADECINTVSISDIYKIYEQTVLKLVGYNDKLVP